MEEDAEEEPEIRILGRLEVIRQRQRGPEATPPLDVEEEPERAEPPERARPAAELLERAEDAEVRAVAADLRSGIRRWRTSRAIRQ